MQTFATRIGLPEATYSVRPMYFIDLTTGSLLMLDGKALSRREGRRFVILRADRNGTIVRRTAAQVRRLPSGTPITFSATIQATDQDSFVCLQHGRPYFVTRFGERYDLTDGAPRAIVPEGFAAEHALQPGESITLIVTD